MQISAIAAAAVALVAMSSPFAAHAGEKLSAEEIAALFPGQYEAIWKDKHQVQVEAGTNGEISGSYGIFFGSGKWWIAGDQLCVGSRWFSKDRCSAVERQGDWFTGMHNGKGEARVRFRPL
jgi:heat shock protein HslJ